MWHRFNQALRNTILFADQQATVCSGRPISTGDLLSGLLVEADSATSRIMRRLNISSESIGNALESVTCSELGPGVSGYSMTIEARNAIDSMYTLTGELGDRYVGDEHLLLSLLREPNISDASRALAIAGVTWKESVRALLQEQQWRSVAPVGVEFPGLQTRKLKLKLRKSGRPIRRAAAAFFLSHKPYMPYMVYRERTMINPYPFYARLRRTPFYWEEMTKAWIVTGYKEAVAALAEPRLSSRIYEPATWNTDNLPPRIHHEFRKFWDFANRWMLFMDSPDHTRHRSMLARRFTPGVIAQMQILIQKAVDEVLDTVAGNGRMEVMADLAVPMPIKVVSSMLGLDPSHSARFRKWSVDFITYIGREATLSQEISACRSLDEAYTYFRAVIESRRREPGDDIVTILTQPDENGIGLTEDDIIANCVLMLVAGYENTTRLISGGLLALLEHPDQLKALRDDPKLMETAIDEMLRYDGPVQWATRIAATDFEWKGKQLKKGQMVRIGLAAANRDPSQFPDPDRLELGRKENRHVAFSNGPHYCLGAALSRLEGKAVFSSLLKRFPNLQLDQPPAWSHDNFHFRELEYLHVRMD